MLFRKNMEVDCSYCRHCGEVDDTKVLCVKYGITSVKTKCRKFVYDPLKRVPVKAKAPDFSKYEEEDFSL